MVMYMNSAQECEDVRHVVTSGWQEQHDDHHDVVCISWDLTGSPADTDLTCCLLSVVGKVETLTVSICLLVLCGLHSQVLPPDGRNSRERRRPHPNTESSADRIGLTFIFFLLLFFMFILHRIKGVTSVGEDARIFLKVLHLDDIHERGSPTSVCSHKTLNTTPIGPSDPSVPGLSPVWSMTSPAAKTHCQNTTSSTGSWTMGKFGGIRENLNLCVTQLWHWEPHKFLSCSGSLFVSSPAWFWVLIYN